MAGEAQASKCKDRQREGLSGGQVYQNMTQILKTREGLSQADLRRRELRILMAIVTDRGYSVEALPVVLTQITEGVKNVTVASQKGR